MSRNFDAKRTWFYFPLFSFFEANIDGRIPNEFELPVTPDCVRGLLRRVANTMQNKEAGSGIDGQEGFGSRAWAECFKL